MDTIKNDKQQVLEFLNRDYLMFAPMICDLEHGDSSILSVCDYGVALMHKDGVMQVAIDDDASIVHFKDRIEAGVLTTVYGNSDPDNLVRAIPSIKKTVACHQVIYTKKAVPDFRHRAQYRLLKEQDADFVFENYSRAWSKDHIKKLLQRDLIWGAYIGDEIVGFIGRHIEGAMGLLEILPKFRRQGFGKELEYFIIDKVLDENKIPYAHIVQGNDVSMSLQGKIEGLEVATRLATWVKID